MSLTNVSNLIDRVECSDDSCARCGVHKEWIQPLLLVLKDHGLKLPWIHTTSAVHLNLTTIVGAKSKRCCCPFHGIMALEWSYFNTMIDM